METKEINLEFFFKFKQYNRYSQRYNIVEKTFNRGMGSLKLFRFYLDKKIVLINKCLFNKSDEKKLDEFLRLNNMSDWNKKFVSYGYPDYYTKSFGLSLL